MIEHPRKTTIIIGLVLVFGGFVLVAVGLSSLVYVSPDQSVEPVEMNVAHADSASTEPMSVPAPEPVNEIASLPSKEITWDDLIPPGVPYSEIIGEGELDEENDIWRPIFDANATKLNTALDGAYVKMPGFVIPLELGPEGVIEFVLVPYVGACIHTPPPPPNQLVLVRTTEPWPSDDLWEPVWVTGRMSLQLMSTEVAETGYALIADTMEPYEQ